MFFLLFTAAHFAREWNATGHSPETVTANLTGQGFADQAILLLEDLHIDLVLFGMFLLFVGSVLFQVRGSKTAKNAIFIALAVGILLYIVCRFLVPLGSLFAIAVTGLFYAVHAAMVVILLWLLLDLYRGQP